MSTKPQTPADAKYAWNQVSKVDSAKRTATERVSDFLEIYSLLDEETARQQAMRCILCPEPSCVEGCPLHNQIPAWMSLTAEGRFLEAAQVLQASGCMTEVFSRLCDHPCEPRCILEGRADTVAINAIERFLNDYAFARGAVDVTLPPQNGFKVAVMNAGPCGLTCAHELARIGCQVAVFDRRTTIGGLLAQGIPSFKMERAVLDRRIALLEKLGVTFKLGAKPGLDPSLRELRSSYDAVFFGAAMGEVKTLDRPGAGLAGVCQGLTFLVQQNTGVPINAPTVAVKGKRVAVLGGGDVAMDCLRTALRCGASDAVCIYRRNEALLPGNPAEYLNAREEGARFEFMADALAVIGNSGNHVTSLRCIRTKLGAPDPDGRPRPEPIPGTEFDIPVDVVLTALGFVAAPFSQEGDLKEIKVDVAGHVEVDAQMMTNIPGVFAGGTLVRGPSAFLDAVQDARQAAAFIDRYLVAQRGAAKPDSGPSA